MGINLPLPPRLDPPVVDLNKSYIGTDANDTFEANATFSNTVDAKGGNDKVNISDGILNTIDMGDGDDVANINGGVVNNINMRSGNDVANVNAGTTNTIDMGAGNNTVNIAGGASNTVNMSTGDDTVKITKGDNNTISTDGGRDNVQISGGVNTVNTGDDSDQVSITGGKSTINTGTGADRISLAGGENEVKAGSDNDTFDITGGKNTLNGEDGADMFRISGGQNAITGGAGADTHHFNRGVTGNHTVTDFHSTEHDRLEFSASDFKDFEDVKSHAVTDTNGNTIINVNDGRGQVTLTGIKKEDLKESDIVIYKDDEQSQNSHSSSSIDPIHIIAGVASAALIGVAAGTIKHIFDWKDFKKGVRDITQQTYEKQLQNYADAHHIPRDRLTARQCEAAINPNECRNALMQRKEKFVTQSGRNWLFSGGFAGFGVGAALATFFLSAVLTGGLLILAAAAIGLGAAVIAGVVSYAGGRAYADKSGTSLISKEINSLHNQQGIDRVLEQKTQQKLDKDWNKVAGGIANDNMPKRAVGSHTKRHLDSLSQNTTKEKAM